MKQSPSRLDPVTDMALGTWGGRGIVAFAHQQRAIVCDLDTEQLVGSPATGESETVAVALGEINHRPILATGSAGGVVTIWDGSSMR